MGRWHRILEYFCFGFGFQHAQVWVLARIVRYGNRFGHCLWRADLERSQRLAIWFFGLPRHTRLENPRRVLAFAHTLVCDYQHQLDHQPAENRIT